MKMRTPEEKREAAEIFEAFSREVKRHLESAGYEASSHDSQEWEVSLSMVRRGTDGSVGFFYGPLPEKGAVAYRIVREADVQSRVFQYLPETGAEQAASAFLSEVQGLLTNRLSPSGPASTGVGRGLQSVVQADEDARIRERT